MKVALIPIKESPEENEIFFNNPAYHDTLLQTIGYYKVIGFYPPWICYYAMVDGEPAGSAAFKGRPVNNKIEIAYGTFEEKRSKGIGTDICRQLVKLARETDPLVIITARTLPEHNHSTRVLEKNNFILTGNVLDPEDGAVWEWIYNG